MKTIDGGPVIIPSAVTFACPQPVATVPARYRKVYWHHFWNRQATTAVHLFRVVGEGYSERGPEEGKSLCGEQIGDDYRELDDYPDKLCCKRCLRSLAKADLFCCRCKKRLEPFEIEVNDRFDTPKDQRVCSPCEDSGTAESRRVLSA